MNLSVSFLLLFVSGVLGVMSVDKAKEAFRPSLVYHAQDRIIIKAVKPCKDSIVYDTVFLPIIHYRKTFVDSMKVFHIIASREQIPYDTIFVRPQR